MFEQRNGSPPEPQKWEKKKNLSGEERVSDSRGRKGKGQTSSTNSRPGFMGKVGKGWPREESSAVGTEGRRKKRKSGPRRQQLEETGGHTSTYYSREETSEMGKNTELRNREGRGRVILEFMKEEGGSPERQNNSWKLRRMREPSGVKEGRRKSKLQRKKGGF